jgi:5-formyltetrahydrofolate cyclo-ligase
MAPIMTDKPTLRGEMARRRDALGERARRCAAIHARLLAMPEWSAARVVHCYLSMRSEVDTHPLIDAALAQGKRVVVPIVVPKAPELSHAWLESLGGDALVPGSFGTFNPRDARPAAPGDWDLTIVPLLAFDRRGYRLGYGKGFYDRLLSAAPATSIGIAFADQEVALLPDEPHDMRLHWIVTEREAIRISI